MLTGKVELSRPSEMGSSWPSGFTMGHLWYLVWQQLLVQVAAVVTELGVVCLRFKPDAVLCDQMALPGDTSSVCMNTWRLNICLPNTFYTEFFAPLCHIYSELESVYMVNWQHLPRIAGFVCLTSIWQSFQNAGCISVHSIRSVFL